MSTPVRQILLCIEELQTFNMVSGIDLRHLGLKPLYSSASVSPLTPEKAPPPSSCPLVSVCLIKPSKDFLSPIFLNQWVRQ